MLLRIPVPRSPTRLIHLLRPAILLPHLRVTTPAILSMRHRRRPRVPTRRRRHHHHPAPPVLRYRLRLTSTQAPASTVAPLHLGRRGLPDRCLLLAINHLITLRVQHILLLMHLQVTSPAPLRHLRAVLTLLLEEATLHRAMPPRPHNCRTVLNLLRLRLLTLHRTDTLIRAMGHLLLFQPLLAVRHRHMAYLRYLLCHKGTNSHETETTAIARGIKIVEIDSGNMENSTAPKASSTPKVEQAKAASIASGTPESRQAATVSEHDADDDDDWTWEEKTIFQEPPKTHQPDPIGKPLPGPLDYHDNIMLPPAWNATCITSEFVKEDNLEEFSRPIRETEFFSTLKYDPVFWKPAPSTKVARKQPVVREKPFKSSRLPGFPSLPPKPPTPETRFANNRKRTWEDSPYQQSPGSSYQEGERRDHGHKRQKGEPHPGYEHASPYARRGRDDDRSIDRYRTQRPERAEHATGDVHFNASGDSREAGHSSRDREGYHARKEAGNAAISGNTAS
ncbi:zinc knuckle domain containing protein [Colletotrichum karsti]|uniref:Zinc knuckle domain containing protein n=1 Tax=Colletotrichum karsti TaxID=1095194 RepID=A0A9P6LIY1_9PEZI|nr:zinc knuckle domain containing protein [Colletotrichum karsti]KAF9874606.1 zinc knuckle domain containing protein [Colletotrichum karsti]